MKLNEESVGLTVDEMLERWNELSCPLLYAVNKPEYRISIPARIEKNVPIGLTTLCPKCGKTWVFHFAGRMCDE